MMWLALAVISSASSGIFVAPNGSDSNPGTQSRPLATLDAARDVARMSRTHHIVLGAGTYRLTHSVEFDQRDSGLLIEALPGYRAFLKGSITIPSEAIQSVKDMALLNRIIDPLARKKVRWVQLDQIGIPTISGVVPRGFGKPIIPSPPELFAGGEPMHVARWPNQGFCPIGAITEPGNGEHDQNEPKRRPVFAIKSDRAKAWVDAKDAWLYGYWNFDWADESIPIHGIDPGTGQITLESPHVFGVGATAKFWIENLIEELDAPGEYYFDRAKNRLYFIPVIGVAKNRYEISICDQPLIMVQNATDVCLSGLDLSFSRGDAVSIHNCTDVRLKACRMFDLGERAAVIDGGSHSGLQSCDIWNTGEGGVALSGGDRKSLVPAHNFVVNCDIHHYQRRSQTYRPAVWIDGVGNWVSHCALHDAPHSAIIFFGNDHIIEYNEFFRNIQLTGDGGVVYTGRDWTARGTSIRFNRFHDNIGLRKWEPAIYVDDLGSGISMLGNLIERCHWGFLIGGGRDNLIRDNVLVDCDLGFDCDARGLGWAAGSRPTMMERLNAMPYQSGIWKSEYPQLASILDGGKEMAPIGNMMEGNLLVRSGKFKQQMEPEYLKTTTFSDNLDGESANNWQATMKKKGISVDKMGLYQDALRRTLH